MFLLHVLLNARLRTMVFSEKQMQGLALHTSKTSATLAPMSELLTLGGQILLWNGMNCICGEAFSTDSKDNPW